MSQILAALTIVVSSEENSTGLLYQSKALKVAEHSVMLTLFFYFASYNVIAESTKRSWNLCGTCCAHPRLSTSCFSSSHEVSQTLTWHS